ncbi:MAG: hypothetical protein ACRENO_03405 [Thermodesulfobacteriota bacterium]
MANAFVFMAGDFKVEKKYSPIYISKIFTSAGFICALISPSEIKHLIMIPALTFIALIYYKPNERYKLLILDGALLAGGILSFVIKQFRG